VELSLHAFSDVDGRRERVVSLKTWVAYPRCKATPVRIGWTSDAPKFGDAKKNV